MCHSGYFQDILVMFSISKRVKRVLKYLLIGLIIFILLFFTGVFHHCFEKDFYNEFHYPYDGSIKTFVEQLKKGDLPDVLPINSYNFKYKTSCSQKCKDVQNLRLVYLIKTDPEHIVRRMAIRKTWGYEHRFSDVEIRTVFLIGTRQTKALQKSIDKEHHQFSDIVQADFLDTYYNNTYKTMMGMQWAMKFCPKAMFYMFVDDDYYVSTKNVLRFLRYPTKYPQYVKDPFTHVEGLFRQDRKPLQFMNVEVSEYMKLYTGYVFQSSPFRHYFSKWYVSLREYPYHMWPPYVTAGAFVLSRSALIDMHYTSFYTQHFRFDDIYVGLLALKANVRPLHCEEFHFYKKTYNKFDFQYTVASHGYGDPEELFEIWMEQRSLGNA